MHRSASRRFARIAPPVFAALAQPVPPTGGEAARSVGEGDDGNAVQEIFSNYQTRPLGGAGILRVMTLDPDARTVEVETFSPFTSLVLDDDENAFVLTDVDLTAL